MEIAAAVLEDVQGIAKVHVRSWQAAYAEILEPTWLAALSIEARAERWQAIITANKSQTVVSRQSGEVTGFVSFGKCRDTGAASAQGEIWALYTAPEKWGYGTGRALLEHAASALREAGFNSVSLWVLSANHRGVKFYEAHGFKRMPGSERVFELGGRQVEEVAYLRCNDA
jgi:ribosomal protein S18 acetylase RimI-like enzyme